MRGPEWGKPALAILAFGVGVAGLWSGRPIERAPGVLVDRAPIQIDTLRDAFVFGQYELTPRAEFDIEARVLSVERYRFDGGAKLSPVDFAVGWGPMSDSSVLEHFRVRQGGRFFTIYPDEHAIDLRTALLGSANIHLIPASSSLGSELKRVRPGHIVRMRGLLVDASGPNGYTWRTSLSRADTGDGACELFYVESVERR